MKHELNDMISEARRKLRRASGAPLTEEEQTKERRLAEIEELEMEMFLKFGARFIGALKISVISANNVVVVEIIADGHTFQLRKDDGTYGLFSITEQGEIDLARIDRSDTDFADRVLVAIGDTLAKPGPQDA